MLQDMIMEQVTKQELNAIMAEIMGWKRNGTIPFWNDANGKKTPYQNSERYKGSNYWNPSTDLNHAFKVLRYIEGLEKIDRVASKAAVFLGHDGLTRVQIYDGYSCITKAKHDDPATAICLALAEAHSGEKHELTSK